MLQHQPRVMFDPTNQEHRIAVRDFLKRNSWGDTQLRFAEDPNYSNIADQVQIKLLDWYLSQENV